jgi:ubiquinone/menaquinone biosynthesis C-methylase UbiE
MQDSKRIEEELMLSEKEAILEYEGITKVIGITYSLLADKVYEMISFSKGTILDLGTGLGDFAIEIARRFCDSLVFGLDISREMIAQGEILAQEQGLNNLKFKLMDVHKLEFEDKSVDLIISHGSLHHWKAPQEVFSQIYRVLKNNRSGFIVDLRRDAPLDLVEEVAGLLNPAQRRGFLSSVAASFLPNELESLFKQIGIKDFIIEEQKFSRQVIVKNLSRLRDASKRSDRFNRLYLNIIIKK